MKEDIKPKDGKRKLYLTIDMQNYILYNFDEKTTCESILKENQKLISSKLSSMNNNINIDLNNYDFFLIDLKNIKKPISGSITKIKINNCKNLYNFLQNPKTILCYLQKSNMNMELNINERKNNLENKISVLKNDELLETRNNYLLNKTIEDFYTNKTIFLYNYDTRTFIKSKGNLSKKQFTIRGKTDKFILIKDIKSIMYCTKENPMVNSLENSSATSLPYYIIIKTNEEQIIIGLKNEDKINKWKEGFDSVIASYKNFTTDLDYQISINNMIKNISENEKKIIDDTLIFENLLKNKEKKKIFYSIFEDKKVAKLIDYIYIYQYSIKNNNYKEGILKLYEILDMINKNNEEKNPEKKSKISEIITKERLIKYLGIYNKANEITNKEDIKNILKCDLFDDSIFYLNQLFVMPYLKKYKEEFCNLSQTNNKSDIQKSIQSLIAYFFLNIYQMNEKNSFLDLSQSK